ncbi:MAG TPA: hypothetical protein VGI39_04935 [Polyangiaceae bacterium]|jgi:hypothetical protein
MATAEEETREAEQLVAKASRELAKRALVYAVALEDPETPEGDVVVAEIAVRTQGKVLRSAQYYLRAVVDR